MKYSTKAENPFKERENRPALKLNALQWCNRCRQPNCTICYDREAILEKGTNIVYGGFVDGSL